MIEPASRRLPGRSKNPDYDLTSPLSPSISHLCKSEISEPISGTYAPGDIIQTKIEGTARHDGGQCQFSLSKDGKNFIVLDTVYEDCPRTDVTYKPMVPPNLKPGPYIYAWSWFNRIGNVEFYMNCADINITGSGTKDLEGKSIVVANIDIAKAKVEGTGDERSKAFKDLEREAPVLGKRIKI